MLMNGRRKALLGLRGSLALALLVGGFSGAAAAQTADVAGMITEIKLGKGTVEVKPAGGAADWRPAGPLMSLLGGDTVRAAGGGSAVILLTGGRGTLRVESGAPPVVVPAPSAGEGKVQKAQALLAASLGFLSSRAKETPQAVLGTRSWLKPPAVLAPRNGPMLADALRFEWWGSRMSRYTVRVLGPSGVVLERSGVQGASLDYPADAPPLVPGIRYTFQVSTEGQPPQEAWFEVLGPERTREVRAALLALEQEAGPATPANTLVALRAGFLAQQGLLHEARRAVLAALEKDRDEATLHLLLGNLYAQSGLPEQADQSLDEARFLMGGRRGGVR
jgi:hypothetical protein